MGGTVREALVRWLNRAKRPVLADDLYEAFVLGNEISWDGARGVLLRA